jgi:choline dehydrogenase-like flavoprotein
MRYVVVGAGSAGCVVAARLSENPDHQVTLLEGGHQDRRPDATEPGIRSLNWIAALGEEDAFWPKIQASRLPGSERTQYMRGRGIGGSGAVNAMICLPGLPEDYARWADAFGCDRWSWSDVEPWFAKLQTTLYRFPLEQHTPVDKALRGAGGELGLDADVDTYTPDDGVGTLYLSATPQGRASGTETWLEPARGRDNLEVRTGVWVDRVLFDDAMTAIGVRLQDGTVMESDQVILCAGAFESPAILLRSGVSLPGLGRNLRDHPAASVPFRLKPRYRDFDDTLPCISQVLRTSSDRASGDIHLLPLHGTLDGGRSDGVVMAALMTVRSTGSVRLDPQDPLAHPVIDMEMLTDEDDRSCMYQALGTLVDVLETEAFQEIVEEVLVDDQGSPLSALRDPAFADRWLQQTMGDYFHACGTCRMGPDDDPDAVVDQEGRLRGAQGVRVIDASIMPDVPAANTHLPTVMLAERLSAGIRDA